MDWREIIEGAWDDRGTLTPQTQGPLREAVTFVLDALDRGEIRICAKIDGTWVVDQVAKKAILLSFRLFQNKRTSTGVGQSYDKLPLKWDSWGDAEFQSAAFRALPGAIVRRGAFVDQDAVLMPSFVNVGACVGAGTMIDTWATVGSCAQVGARCHISGGVGLGGVLEPLQANPVIIEDNCFIGARSEIVEGVLVEEGSVIGMGVFIGASTPIIDRVTGEITRGRVPPYSVVIAGSLPSSVVPQVGPTPHLNCAVIVKRVDAQTRSKTDVNDLLRAA